MEREESVIQFEAYLKRRFPDRRTARDYVSDLRQFMAVCSKPWQDVNLHDIDAFVDQQRQKGLKPSTIKRRTAALKTFFDFLAEESGDLSWPNPVRMKRHAGKQAHKLPRDLSDEKVAQVWAVIASPRDRAWFALMLRAGLRVGEVVDLELDDILSPAKEGQAARVRVYGKGRKERVVLLSADAYAVVQAWLQERPSSPHPQIFLNERDGGPLTENGIEFCLRQHAQRAGIAVTPHQLRHTYARQLTEAGIPLTSLGKLMGHAQVSTTQIYTAGADPELAQAYQQAIQHLESATLPPPTPAAHAAPAPVISTPAIQEQRIVKPDWQAWATDLPDALRQASLTFVQRRWPTWKPRRRRLLAHRFLAEFQRFWTWQMQYRPIQSPSELNLHDFHAYQTQRSAEPKPVTSRTVDSTIGLVLSLLRQLADQEIAVDANIFRFRPRPRPESLPRHLSETEAQQLERYVSQRFGEQDALLRLENACFFTLAHAGLRAGECLDLCLQDLDLPGRRLLIRDGKGLRDRCVYLSDTACQAMQRYLDTVNLLPSGPLFILPDGHPITYPWLLERITALANAAGVAQVTPHRLRHTLATRLLNAGMDITRIQKLLGHEHVNTTMIYARIHDRTVEADYHRAMQQVEHQQMPLSNTPLAVENWPSELKTNNQARLPLDNSV